MQMNSIMSFALVIAVHRAAIIKISCSTRNAQGKKVIALQKPLVPDAPVG